MSPMDKGSPLPPLLGAVSPEFERAAAKPKRITSRFDVAAAMAVLAFWAFPLAAQRTTTRIDGVVRVGTGQEETGGASVKLYDPQLGLVDSTVTNTQGRFYFPAVRTGDYTLVTSKPGYYTKEQELKVQFTMAEQYVTVFLTPEGPLVKGKGEPQVSAAELALPPKIRDEFENAKNDLKKKKYAAAIRRLKAVTDAQPQFAFGLEVLGVAYYRSGDSAKAAAAFQKALERDSKRGECYIQLGLISYEQNHYAESEKYLQTGLGMEPDSWFGHYQLGLTFFALGNYPQSETELRKAEELDLSFHEVHVRLGNLYLRKADAAKALAEFEKYLRKDLNGRFAPRVREVVKEMRTAGVAPPS